MNIKGNNRLTQIIDCIFKLKDAHIKIPREGVIKTESNLNSTVFEDIMAAIGLQTAAYQSDYNLIDEVLLNMRNRIAHGERLVEISLDELRYNEIHEKVLQMIENFAYQIMNAASNKDYQIMA